MLDTFPFAMSRLQVLLFYLRFPARFPHDISANVYIGRYIMSAPHLRELSLSFGQGEISWSNPPTPRQWEPEHLGDVSENVRLQELAFPQLSHMWVEEHQLVGLFLAHKDTLRSLTLECIYLYQGSWESVLSRLRDNLSLDYLEVHDLRVGDGSDGMADIDGELFGQAATTTIMRGEAEEIHYEGPRLAWREE